MYVKPVPAEFVNQTWPLIEGYIEDAFTYGDPGESLYTLDNVRGYVTSGAWLLCVVVDKENKIHGAGTISFTNYPMHRVAFITTVGGRLICNKDTAEQVKSIARQNGASVLQAFGRPSAARLWRRFNFESRNTLVEVLL